MTKSLDLQYQFSLADDSDITTKYNYKTKDTAKTSFLYKLLLNIYQFINICNR